MRIKTLLLILLLTLIIISGCTQVSEKPGEELAEKSTGGVIICGVDCPCGQADNVCPEDYGAECEVEDPDCE